MSTTKYHTPLGWYGLISLLAIFVYFYGLDSQHIPKNGDEDLYAHITRVTAETGRLLPLQSDMQSMRDTKPPGLFWQGILTTHWGKQWQLFNLRYPNVIYTLLTGLMVFLLGWRLTGRLETGFIALLSFLAFFSTYRYGRPFLTNAPEMFWLFVPFFGLLYWKEAAFASRLWAPLVFGIAIGIGLFYKSFMLVIPVMIGLSLWYLQYRHYQRTLFISKDAGKIGIIVFVSLAIFSLWFVFDADRSTIWNHFVIRENFSDKFYKGESYFKMLFSGSSSIWTMVLGYPANAALLAFPVFSLFWLTYKRRKEISASEKMLWIWMLVLIAVFSLPSQRSSRYLLDGMPALAVLLSLNWHRLSQKSFALTLLATAMGVAFIAYFSLRLEQYIDGKTIYPTSHWLLLVTAFIIILAAMARPKLMRNFSHAAIFLFFLSMATFLRPFDGELGNYNQDAIQKLKGHDVWVPFNFTAKYERYGFVLPGAIIHGYPNNGSRSADELLEQHPRIAFQTYDTKPVCMNCRIIGQRYVLRTRATSQQTKEAIFNNALQYVFATEYLLERQNTVLSSHGNSNFH